MHGELGSNITYHQTYTVVCSNVVVPKALGAVQICVDMKPLNEHVLQGTSYPGTTNWCNDVQ